MLRPLIGVFCKIKNYVTNRRLEEYGAIGFIVDRLFSVHK